MRRWVLPFCLLLAACGQTGPLVLPGPSADDEGADAPAAAAPAAEAAPASAPAPDPAPSAPVPAAP